MDVGLDLRLINTNTLEVADVISYQKQIIGRQEQAGAFDFLGQTFFDASIGESALEPVQLAVRSVIERAVLQMISRLYHQSGVSSANALGAAADPLASPDERISTAAAQLPAAKPEEINNDQSHQNAYRWYGSDDPSAQPNLRTGIE